MISPNVIDRISPNVIDRPSSSYTDVLLQELRTLIGDLGKDGGIISPSVYDTAQVLRFYPPAEGVEPALEWLLSQQQADGGWGDPIAPYARDMPTMAAILSLHQHGTTVLERRAVKAGLAFIGAQRDKWIHLPEEIPVAAELIIPALVKDIRRFGLGDISGVYISLMQLSRERFKRLIDEQPGRENRSVFSWEAWGDQLCRDLVDANGSVGSSPAATAMWLQRSSSSPSSHSRLRLQAEKYLHKASRATTVDIPGVCPTVWPLDRFEQAFSLYALVAGGAIRHPGISQQVRNQIDDLGRSVKPNGIGFNDHFVPDGDDTAASLAVLSEFNIPIEGNPLSHFMCNDHFVAYLGELQSSLSLTARSTHAMHSADQDVSVFQHYLSNHQQRDGRWLGDKWNVSWIYTTSHVLLALSSFECSESIRSGVKAILDAQRTDGAWGTGLEPCPNETAYALIGLRAHRYLGFEEIECAILSGRIWLRDNALKYGRNLPCPSSRRLWQNKELYSPYRIDRAYQLGAIFDTHDLQ